MERSKKLILIIDDSSTTLKSAGDVLKSKYDLAMVNSGIKGLEYLENHKPDLILLDVIMPEMDGFETIKRIKANKNSADIPVIFLTGDMAVESESLGFSLGAVDYITKPFDNEAMLYRIEKILEYEKLKKNLETEVRIKTEQLEKMTIHVFITLSNIVDNKNASTIGHSQRVAAYAKKIAQALNWSEQDTSGIYYIALLHDIGKIGISEAILGKTAPLTNDEKEILGTHAEIGSEILKDFTLIKNMAEGIRYHHARYDGSDGISGNDIPIEARVIAVADYIDLARTEKENRPALTNEELIDKLKVEKDGQFDPVLVEIAIDIIKSGFVAKNSDDGADNNHDVVNFSNAILERVLNEYTEELKNKAQKDPLTGLWNRQYMAQNVNTYLSVKGTAGALLMIDMDNFKNVNDTFGHITGDEIIIALSEVLTSNVQREEDIVCRLGGDEFVVFITSAKAKNDVENICRHIADDFEKKLDDVNPRVKTSVSIGIALSNVDGNNFETLYSNADKALYFVKQNQKGAYHFYIDAKQTTDDKEHTDKDSFLYKILNAHGEPMQAGSQGVSRMLDFVEQYTVHDQQKVQVVLFTLKDVDEHNQESAFEILHSAVCSNLRRGDVFARYSDIQYIVMLMNVEAEIGKKVALRIESRFNDEMRLQNNDSAGLVYDIFSINDENS